MLFGTVFINQFWIGTIYLAGFYNVYFLERYGRSKSLTSWPSALTNGWIGLGGNYGSSTENALLKLQFESEKYNSTLVGSINKVLFVDNLNQNFLVLFFSSTGQSDDK
jgi:hypothetical protein